MKMVDKTLKEIGNRISERRKALHLTQENLAEQMDISVQMVSNLECGRKSIRVENLIKLSKILDISCDYILTGKRTENDTNTLSAKIASLSAKDCDMIEMLVDYCIGKNNE